MTELEKMAKTLFDKYSEEYSDKPYEWKYLSAERKLKWMEEILFISDLYKTNLTTKFKLDNSKYSTSYEMGLIQGINKERIRISTVIKNIHNDLLVDFDEFKEINK